MKRHMRTFYCTISVAAGLTMAACSNGDDDEADQSFCDDFSHAQDELAQVTEPTPDNVQHLVEHLEGIDPPADIQEPYDNLLDTYRQIADGTPLTDPGLASGLADTQTNLDQIQTYVSDNCPD
jgi:hypothetical protein